jgi:hypothetical protein
MFGTILQLQFKLIKHLGARNHRRVADYVAHVLSEYSESEMPIDPGLWKQAKDFLKESGYTAAVVDGKVWLKTPDQRWLATDRAA